MLPINSDKFNIIGICNTNWKFMCNRCGTVFNKKIKDKRYFLIKCRCCYNTAVLESININESNGEIEEAKFISYSTYRKIKDR